MLVSVAVCAQNRPVGPTHPLSFDYYYYNDGEFVRYRIKADSVTYKEYNGQGEKTGDYYSIYRHDTSDTLDFVTTYWGSVRNALYEYDSKERFILVSNDVEMDDETGMLKIWIWSEYQYDAKGRVISRDDYSVRTETHRTTTYLYTEDSIVSSGVLDDGYLKEITLIDEKTDNGYTARHITEMQYGAILKHDTVVKNYVFDEQNRLIRAGNIKYTYPREGGYRSEEIDLEGEVKKVHWYDEHGYLKTQENYVDSRLTSSLDIYYYNTSESNVPVEFGLTGVYGAKGVIVITVEKPSIVRIYSVAGKLVGQTSIGVGTAHIPIPAGIYVVSIDGKACKIAVQ